MHTTKIRETKQSNAGFTLVELLVVFILMLMLASLSVIGVMAYQDYADYNRQNSYAQTLFTAAQTKLTAYSVRGQLEDLQEVSVNMLELGDVKTPDGLTAQESKKGLAAKAHTIYYLTGSRENYEAYCQGEYKNKSDMQSREYQALYDIFDEFVFDKSLLNGSIALEYNPTDGLVYSVLYSDKCGGFTYTGNTVNGIINVLDRRDDVRSERLLGYYGVD